jgi:hypothetical protein
MQSRVKKIEVLDVSIIKVRNGYKLRNGPRIIELLVDNPNGLCYIIDDNGESLGDVSSMSLRWFIRLIGMTKASNLGDHTVVGLDKISGDWWISIDYGFGYGSTVEVMLLREYLEHQLTFDNMKELDHILYGKSGKYPITDQRSEQQLHEKVDGITLIWRGSFTCDYV